MSFITDINILNSFTLKHFIDFPFLEENTAETDGMQVVYKNLSFNSDASTETEENDSSERNIVFIKMNKIIELLTSEVYQGADIFDLVMYGYRTFCDEFALLKHLLIRFESKVSEGSEENNRKSKTIKIKILIFLQSWFRTYKTSLIMRNSEIEEMLIESLFLIYTSQKSCPKWAEIPITRILLEMEEFKDKNKVTKHEANIRKETCIFSEYLIIKAYRLIRIYKKKFVECLTIFDFQSFENINPVELLYRTKDPKRCEKYYLWVNHFNSLARFIAFLILNINKTYKRISFFEDCVDLAEELLQVNNFFSSFAVYLGLRHSSVIHLKGILGERISKNYQNKLNELSNFFDSQERVKKAHDLCVLPCVPMLSIYTREITIIDESYKLMSFSEIKEEAQKDFINYLKIKDIAKVFKKLNEFKQCRYNFENEYEEKKVKEMEFIPIITEETLFKLSDRILEKENLS